MPADAISEAAHCIRNGGIVGIPTETYYGLAVDTDNEQAINRLFQLKQRPSSKPVLVLISAREQLDSLALSVPDRYHELMEEYWPGPLTLVFPAKPEVSSLLTAGTGTIGVRMTPHPVTVTLIQEVGKPITATSANISGRKAARSAEEVRTMFKNGLDYVIDGGSSGNILPSTVIRSINNRLCIERSGSVDLGARFPLCNE